MVKKFFIFTGISLGLLLLWMLWNMMQFSSRQIDFSIAEEIIIEEIEAVKHLSNAITYKNHISSGFNVYRFTDILII